MCREALLVGAIHNGNVTGVVGLNGRLCGGIACNGSGNAGCFIGVCIFKRRQALLYTVKHRVPGVLVDYFIPHAVNELRLCGSTSRIHVLCGVDAAELEGKPHNIGDTHIGGNAVGNLRYRGSHGSGIKLQDLFRNGHENHTLVGCAIKISSTIVVVCMATAAESERLFAV